MLCSYKEKIAHWEWYDADIISSTNDEIKNIVQTNKHIILSAIEQTKGRGRRGRDWLSITGNLYFSYSLEVNSQNLSQIVCIIGLSLAKTITTYLTNKDVKIKWPNDVFVENKKISGILIENIKDNLWAIGVGVNVISSPKLDNSVYEATSLAENGVQIDREEFLKQYMSIFAKDYQLYQNKGFLEIKQEWMNFALNHQQEITIKTEKEIKTGIFFNLDDNGYLILKTNKGEERIVAGDLFI